MGKTEKGRDRGERALQISGSAQRLSGARHRKTPLEKAKAKKIDMMPLIKYKESKEWKL